ncbi:hypothetical protein [Ramlibacter sp.]
MALELPTLRISLAGFSLEQQDTLRQTLQQDRATGLTWELSTPEDADALWINGARTQLLADGLLRVASGVPAGRSMYIDPANLNRPAAFALPVPRQFPACLAFEIEPGSVAKVLRELEVQLRPLVAQFCLASQILEQEAALGSGVYHVQGGDGTLLAVVDLRGDVGVLTDASAMGFDNAMWTPQPRRADQIPAHFFRCTLSKLMWEYALRTSRDVLPARYRTDLLFFRRPPRLPQRLLQDAHLLVLRELTGEPATFSDLEQRTGLAGPSLARHLAALYLVGAITSNPKRAAPLASQPPESREDVHSTQASFATSRQELETSGLASLMRLPPRADRTAPAPISLDR